MAEKGSLAPQVEERNCISEVVTTDVQELEFRCPACGGELLSYGVKSYQKAVIYEDGEMGIYGGDSIGDGDVDFACWNCRHVMTDNGEPIRRVEDMLEWLKAHVPSERGE